MDCSCYLGPKAPLLVCLAWNEIMMILWRISSSVPRMAKIGGSFLGPNFGLVYSFINGFISSCKLSAATMAASKYAGCSAVFSRCSELPAAGFKNVLMYTG